MSGVIVASQSLHFPLLTAIVVLPAIGALAVALTPSRRPDLSKTVGILFAVGTFALAIAVLVAFKTHPHLSGSGTLGLAHREGFQLVDKTTWIRQYDINWFLGVDGISLWLVMITALLFPIGMIGARSTENAKAFMAWMLVLEFGCIGTFLALDLFLFFVMFEIVLVPMYFLIVGWGHEDRRYAGNKFFLYTMFGSAFMLVGIVSLVALNAHHTGHVTFNLLSIATSNSVATTTGRWLFLAFGIAFAVKVPLVPVHTWLADAHTQAPTAGSVILAGVLLKLGAYGFLRYGLYLFPKAAVYFAPLMVTLGVVGILYGAVVATMQKDLKRVVAVSSVAHLGFIALGLFAITTTSVQGGVLQMVNHAISTPALFILIGYIYDRRHTRLFTSLKGMQKRAPILAGLFIFMVFASIGLPGLNGFAGEFLILVGSFVTRRWWAVAAAIGVILAALYLLWAFQKVFHGVPDEPNEKIRDLDWKEILVISPLVVLVLVIGLYPKPFLTRMQPSVDHLISHVEQNSNYRQPAVTKSGHEAKAPPKQGDQGGDAAAPAPTGNQEAGK